MKKMTRIFGITIITAVGLAACGQTNTDHKNHESKEEKKTEKKEMNQEVTAPKEMNESASNDLLTTSLKNVTRLNTNDPLQMAVLTSQTIWPATHKENQPGAIILVPVNEWQLGTASADLIHHPNNGPILFIEKEKVPEMTLKEIKRLNPLGTKDGTQIMVMGDVGASILEQLKEYKVKQIKETDPATFAKDVDKEYADITGSYPNSVIIGSSEEEGRLYTTPAVNWISHMPEPLLYTEKDKVPKATIEALKMRKDKANIYVLGPEKIISKEVEKELSKYGKVTRISGETPVENSIAFAKFKDEKTKFGWGFKKPGHGVSFVSNKTPDLAVAGAPFSHMGKHAPVIFLEEGKASQPVYDFLATIQPKFKDDPTLGPYNHGFLLGSTSDISFETQGVLDERLEIVQESGQGHGGH
ncbi:MULTISPECIES: cell wall-binding repeat-containing protein [Bacillus cereus group]|uniref:cell wall-binding repeat-containing protein n=1 Tax=Bacillus cereus group TaxID=86661 RepID=UPI0011A7340A|nr:MULTISPECIES: cell wall-binding repeat-containing protein [Bacillus cereus group]MBR9657622.1 ArsR family transcriptional regulator [Bacillus cereus]MCU4901351.1 cell wall-binding repeat-containing protein [Bacillus cereus]MCU5315232.1 cell wall-binding repeat-containing protein [Bacillus cereus]MCU5482063.1 cell wall-binding repeat-containing protein [Bacillus cereus]